MHVRFIHKHLNFYDYVYYCYMEIKNKMKVSYFVVVSNRHTFWNKLTYEV